MERKNRYFFFNLNLSGSLTGQERSSRYVRGSVCCTLSPQCTRILSLRSAVLELSFVCSLIDSDCVPQVPLKS